MIWRNVQKNENKLSFQRSCHYQTTEHCLATDNDRSTSSWKETGGARGGGGAPQIKFDLGKFYTVFKLFRFALSEFSGFTYTKLENSDLENSDFSETSQN